MLAQFKENIDMTKIDIISGFLGAGKTTLIKKLLTDKAFGDEKVVLVENEFGEIGVDGGFLKNAGIEITEMNSGCICCSLVGDFKEALHQVIKEFNPDRILIEPSGVGKLSDVIKACQAVENVTLEHYITVVDSKKCRVYMKSFGEFFNDQVEHASTIILSRTQDLDEQQVDEVVGMLRKHNENATILTTPWDQLEGNVIMDAIHSNANDLMLELEHEYECEHEHHHHDHECECGHEHHHHDHECECGHEYHHHDHECECGHEHHHHDHECECGHEHHHHHHADEVFSTWGTQTTRVFTKEKLSRCLESLFTDDYGTVLRCKGIVSGKDTWYYFDMVPGELEIREGKPDYTGRLCVIGSKLDEQKLAELFLGE